MQPTADEINRAWTVAIECEGIGGARAESVGELLKLRRAKTTWVGPDENKLRFALDDYLRALGYTIGGAA